MADNVLATRLPASRTQLFGRERALATLHDLCLHADERLLTLTGVGGCGKTRLAFEFAADLLPAFPRRVWLVELATITEPTLVPVAIASTLGLREEAGGSPLATLTTSSPPSPRYSSWTTAST